MKANKNEDLAKALSEVKLAQIPKKTSDKIVWVKAIIKAKTHLGNTTYCIGFQKKLKGMPIIKRTFTNEAIIRLEEVYPYVILDPNVIKTIDKQTKEETFEMLKTTGVSIHKNIDAYSEEEIRDMAIQNQIDIELKKNPNI